MEFPTPSNVQNRLYPFTINISSSRTNERFPAVSAHQALATPDYSVSYDSIIDSYVITFRRVWKRINLPANMFHNMRVDDPKLSNEEKLLRIEAEVSSRLQPIVDIVNHYRNDVRPKEGCDFSSLAFWEAVRLTHKPLYMRLQDVVSAAFSLPPQESEVLPVIQHAELMGKIINFGEYELLLLPTQTASYYENPAMLLRDRDFRVVSQLENKQVGWFLNREVTLDVMQQEFYRANIYPKYYAYYHANQNLGWPHVFIYASEEGVMIGQAYNVYRNWRMLHEIQTQHRYEHVHLTYAYGGFHFGRGLLYQLLSSCPYPKDFSPIMYRNYKRISQSIDECLDEIPIPDRGRLLSVHRRFFKPTIGTYIITPETEINRNEYTAVTWDGIELADVGMHEGDTKGYRLTIATLPDPAHPAAPFFLKDGSNFLTLDSKWDWATYSPSFFTSVALPLGDEHQPQPVPEAGELRDYRMTWNDFRDMTIRPRVKTREINERSLTQVFGDKFLESLEAHPILHDIMTIVLAQEVEKRVRWNNSTAKLLGLVDALYAAGILDHARATPYSVQFFGTITEPVQDLLKLLPEEFNVAPGIGAQAREFNLRTNIANLLYHGTPHIVISDIDQSEEQTEEEIAAIVSEHIRQMSAYARVVLAYKLQYVTPRVLNILMNRLADQVYYRVFLVKPLASGVFSLEAYLVFQIGAGQHLNPSLITDWLEDRHMLLEPKPDFVQSFRVKSMVNSGQVLASLGEPQHFYYMFRARNQEEYDYALDAASSLSERVNVVPVGDPTNFEMFIYGSRWRKRAALTLRVGRISRVQIAQGGDKYPTSGPLSSSKVPITLPHGIAMTESGFYNLAIKRRIVQALREHFRDLYPLPKALMDIGGRACEGINFTLSTWDYTVMDRHYLPDYMNLYNVVHLNEYTDWNHIEPFERYDIIVCIFVLMIDASADEQYARIAFLKRLSDAGKVVIFNYYSDTRADDIDAARHRSITYSADHLQGTFGDYVDNMPFLLDDTNAAFDDTEILRVTLADCLSAQLTDGLSVSPELVNWLRDFNDFCPLRKMV
nr:MAG: hypothetical protein [brine shrimp reovirus 1]